MRALLVYPKFPPTFWSFKYAMKFISKEASMPPLGLITIASLLPEAWDKKLVDLNVNKLKSKDLQWADYVFISAMSIQERSVQHILEVCQNFDVKTVAGGPLFTSDPEKFELADHLILNEAELTLPQFLNDLVNANPRRVYTSNSFPELDQTPTPMYELLDLNKYASMCIQYSRGCPFNCEFCDISVLYGKKVRKKQKDQLINELNRLYNQKWRGYVFFVDDNFIGNKSFLKSVILPAIIEWNKTRNYPFTFSTEVSINLADDEELMEMMIRAGFSTVFVGIESPDENSLRECSKQQNTNRDQIESVNKMQRFGFHVTGGFIVGFDNDTPSIFRRQIEFIQNSHIVTAMVGLLNAPKHTKLYDRLIQEGRLLREISGDNTDNSINFIPKMNHSTLINGYKDILKNIYSYKAFYERVISYLKQYRIRLKTQRAYNSSRYLMAFIRTIWYIGILDRGRKHFWKLILWCIISRPKLLPLAITYSIYGFHFRKVFNKHF